MTETKPGAEKDSVPFYPDHVRTEVLVMGGMMVIAMLIGAYALFSPVGLGMPADPMETPAHVKPEWYFLALYQLLKYIPKTVGVIIPLILVAVVTLLPFLDRKPDSSARARRVRFAVVAIGMLVLIALTIWGEAS
jgi:quinol-cytochrome oxidoreductase complex cytochrome b subunit